MNGVKLNKLPLTIDINSFVQDKKSLSGCIAINEMHRLHDLLNSSAGEVQVNLSGFTDPAGFKVVAGHLVTEVHVLCQRCLQDMLLPLKIEVKWSPIFSEAQEKALDKQYEPMYVSASEPLDLIALIEDELILNIPMICMHEIAVCASKGRVTEPKKHDAETQQPFKNLKDLI